MNTRQIILTIIFVGQRLSSFGEPPYITRQPSSQVMLLGRAAAFEVGAAGTAPLAYQWQVGGTNIPNATKSAFEIQEVKSIWPQMFTVTVSNIDGAVRSRQVLHSTFDFTLFNKTDARFKIWGMELTRYEIQNVSDLTQANTWQSLGVGMVPVNINTASVELLTRIPAIDDNLAQAIVQRRAGPDGVDGTEDDTPFRNVGELGGIWFPTWALGSLTTLNPPALFLGIGHPPPGVPNPRLNSPTNFPNGFYRVVLLDDLP